MNYRQFRHAMRAGARAAACAALMLSAFAMVPAHAATIAGATPGQISVTPTGAAQYTVPIVVPPGVGGIQPALALTYNSRAANGLIGVGWNLSGFSTITRCPKTLSQDGVIGGINYDANDKYCLDGQRLVAISGTYGANGTEYRTERETFSRIISYGAVGTTGPAWFKVWTKSGQVIEYGNTADSAIEAQGKTAIRVWALNKISDVNGNYLTVTYTEDNPNGQYYPSRIDYTGNTAAGLAPAKSVRFVYQNPRPDIDPSYTAGSLSQFTVLLTNVQTYVGANMVKDYRLAYGQSSGTKRSTLASLTECDGAATQGCLNPTSFIWQDGGTGLVVPVYNTPALSGTLSTGQVTHSGATAGGSQAFAFVADFNGDGRADFMFRPSNGDGRYLIAYGTANGLSIPDYNNPALPATLANGMVNYYHDGVSYMYVADFNGDGKADYMWLPDNGDGRYVIAYGTSTGLTTPDYNNPALPNLFDGSHYNRYGPSQYEYVADFNGDGRADYMWLPGNGDGRYVIAYGTDTGFTVPSYSAPALANLFDGVHYNRYDGTHWQRIGDFNGDGRADYMWIPGNGDGRFLVAYGTDTGFTTPDYNSPAIANLFDGSHYNRWNGTSYEYIADFNGDGKADYMWAPWNGDGRFVIAYGTGTGFTSPDYASPALQNLFDGTYSSRDTQLGCYNFTDDFNGDGKADYMWLPGNGDGRYLIAYSNGHGFDTPVYASPVLQNLFDGVHYNRDCGWQYLADFNGDGKVDYMFTPAYAGSDVRWLISYAVAPGQAPDLLLDVTTGLGAITSLTYEPLTNVTATVYAKDNTAVYPVQDIQNAMYVVSSLSSSDGVGGSAVTNYTYAGAKTHLRGGGFLGFRQVAATNAQTGIKATTTYGQGFTDSTAHPCPAGGQLDTAYPYCLYDRGLPLALEKDTASAAILSQAARTWSFTTNSAYGPQYHVPLAVQSNDATYELASNGAVQGALVTQTTTCNTYDAFGNPIYTGVWSTNVSSCASPPPKTGLFVNETNNTYLNDTTNWFLGRLTGSMVTKTTP